LAAFDPGGAGSPEERSRGAGLDVALGLLVLLLCGAILAASVGLPGSPYEPLGPASFPQGVAAVMAILALVVLGQGVRRLRAGGRRAPAVPGGGAWLAAGSYGLSVLFILAMSQGLVGYRAGSVLYVVAMGVLLTRVNPRAVPIVLLLALILGLGTHYVFTRVFVVDLP